MERNVPAYHALDKCRKSEKEQFENPQFLIQQIIEDNLDMKALQPNNYSKGNQVVFKIANKQGKTVHSPDH